MVMTIPTKKPSENICESNEDDNKNPHSRHDSINGFVSTTQVTKSVAHRHFGQMPEPQLFRTQSLLDESEEDFGDIIRQDNIDAKTSDTEDSESGLSTLSLEDALALEVGLTAHEYLEECFYTEVSVLDRDKFNAIPEIVKSDFTITGHLGKGSFSDVFEVVCKAGHLRTKLSNPIPSGSDKHEPLERRRSTRGRRSSLSNSINIASLSRPPQNDGRKLVLAMKCLRPQIRSDADQFTVGAEDLVHETAILANLSHRHIIKVHGRASGDLADAFVLNDGYFILLDRLSETLQDRIGEWKLSAECTLQGPTAKQIEVAQSIADAVSYLHSKKIIFRDLKPDNVGFDSMGVLKLFDFGFAVGLPERDEENPAGFLFDRCGTPRYMAPEVGLSLGYDLKADVYSFGVLLWEVCALTKPFASITSSGEFERDVFMGGKRPVIENRWPTAMKELISSCWSASPNKRPIHWTDIKSSLSSAMAGEKKSPSRITRPRMTRRSSTDG